MIRAKGAHATHQTHLISTSWFTNHRERKETVQFYSSADFRFSVTALFLKVRLFSTTESHVLQEHRQRKSNLHRLPLTGQLVTYGCWGFSWIRFSPLISFPVWLSCKRTPQHPSVHPAEKAAAPPPLLAAMLTTLCDSWVRSTKTLSLQDRLAASRFAQRIQQT